MADADECQNIGLCSREAPQQQLELDDPSIPPETIAGAVIEGPHVVTSTLTPCNITYLQHTFIPLVNTPAAAPAAPGAAPGAAPNAPQYAVKAVELQTYARSAIEHIIQARNSAVDNARIADTYHLCGEVIKFAVAVGEAVTAVTSASEPVAVALTAAAAAATVVVNRASTIFADFYAAATANPSVAEAAFNSGIKAVRIEATPSLGGVVSPADAAIDIAKQNNNPDYFYAAAAASAAVAAVAIIAGNSDLYNIYNERAISAFSNGTNPVTNSDDVLSRTVDDPTDVDATTGTDPLTYCFGIMDLIEQGIKQTLLAKYLELLKTLGDILSNTVPILPQGRYKGFVGITKCGFLSKYTTVIYYAGYIPYNQKDIIASYMTECHRQINAIVAAWPVASRNFTLTCKLETSNLQYDTQKIILCISCGSSHNIIQIPILNVVGFPVFQDVNPLLQLCVNPPSLPCFVYDPTPEPPQFLSLLDIIVRVRICANQGAITALSEPSKEEVTLIRSCFQALIPTLPTVISTITQAMRQILYTEANINAFALFCNIFYNFINVSLGFRSLAKIIYSEFFGTSDNYGKVIRTCQVVNSLPIMRDHVKFFLTGSNAARVYLALNDIIKLGATISKETIEPILSKTFGNLSDNDFMIYLKNADSEPFRVFIRMILGGSFYFFKYLFDLTMVDPTMLVQYNFTETMIQSVGIVGFMDHLFAQRFDASPAFLRRCYEKDTTSFLANMLRLGHMPYFDQLDKQINVAHLDGVFKYYTLVTFYTKMFYICKINLSADPASSTVLLNFLINKATSIDCIATVWTLVLNVLYTLFVSENCLARIAVGKFDNDPKNLKLYMEILNDHLLELQTLGYTHPDIPELIGIQTHIVGTCQTSITTGARLQPDFKQACDIWVKKMVEMAVSGPAGQGLFMLSVSDALDIRRPLLQKELCSTNLERALCLAYLPTSQGNICSASSLLPQSSPFYGQISNVLAGNTLYDPNPLIEVIKRSQIMDVNEIKLHPILGHMGLLMDNCFQQSNTSPIVPNPYVSNKHISVEERVVGRPWPLSTYLNDHWKHLTETAIDLKIFFKENLIDIKRVTGIKYIALVLGGYFQIRLLIDDVSDQCRDDKRAELESFKTPQETPDDSDETPDDSDEMPDDSDETPDLSQKIKECRRGLLPLLIQPPLLVLIKEIIQMDLQTGTDYGDPIPRILKILGFLFSIKVKLQSSK